MSAKFVATLLSTCEFDSRQVAALSALLSDKDGHWRLAGVNLLVSPHMSVDDVEAHARVLENDPEFEIRERLRRLLSTESR